MTDKPMTEEEARRILKNTLPIGFIEDWESEEHYEWAVEFLLKALDAERKMSTARLMSMDILKSTISSLKARAEKAEGELGRAEISNRNHVTKLSAVGYERDQLKQEVERAKDWKERASRIYPDLNTLDGE